MKQNERSPRPEWLKVRLGGGAQYRKIRHLVTKNQLHTVCESAHCPNIGECWSRGTATFMILGDICTRSCKFCNIKTGRPLEYDHNEPYRIAHAVKEMNLNHVVITMVTRDDLKDGGATLLAKTIRQIRNNDTPCTIEVLISDLKGKKENLNIILEAKPDIVNHNLETVKRLQKSLRAQAKYKRSLQILNWAKEKGFITKSGFMIGIGEKINEIIELMKDLRSTGCNILTIGQYLPPTKMHFPLTRYYHPEEFANLKKIGLQLGFKYIESNPLVRSSYHADKQIMK